jgi:hypothetical protein
MKSLIAIALLASMAAPAMAEPPRLTVMPKPDVYCREETPEGCYVEGVIRCGGTEIRMILGTDPGDQIPIFVDDKTNKPLSVRVIGWPNGRLKISYNGKVCLFQPIVE